MLMLMVMFFNDVVDVIDFIKSINVVLFVHLSMLMFTLLCTLSYYLETILYVYSLNSINTT